MAMSKLTPKEREAIIEQGKRLREMIHSISDVDIFGRPRKHRAR